MVSSEGAFPVVRGCLSESHYRATMIFQFKFYSCENIIHIHCSSFIVAFILTAHPDITCYVMPELICVVFAFRSR